MKLILAMYCTCALPNTEGIVMEAHSPLGRPAKSAQSGKPVILKDPTIEKVAAKHGATLAQVGVAVFVTDTSCG